MKFTSRFLLASLSILMITSLVVWADNDDDKRGKSQRNPCRGFVPEGNTIYACANPAGQLRSVECPAACRPNETLLTWNIAGPAGPQGPEGPQGPAGADGADGPQGPAGANGSDGAPGPQGPAGPQGEQGLPGPQGPAGVQGPAGADGAIGPQGPQGEQGPAGPQGPQGLAGANGADGAAGPQGPQGAPGAIMQIVTVPLDVSVGPVNQISTANTTDPYTMVSSITIDMNSATNTVVVSAGGTIRVEASPSSDYNLDAFVRIRETTSGAILAGGHVHFSSNPYVRYVPFFIEGVHSPNTTGSAVYILELASDTSTRADYTANPGNRQGPNLFKVMEIAR